MVVVVLQAGFESKAKGFEPSDGVRRCPREKGLEAARCWERLFEQLIGRSFEVGVGVQVYDRGADIGL